MENYQMTLSELQNNLNKVKDALFEELSKDGLLDISYREKYAVVVAKKGYFGDVLDKVLGLEDDKTPSFRILSLK